MGKRTDTSYHLKENKTMMNKERRTFIWGLILMIICGLGCMIHLKNIACGTFQGGVQFIFFLSSIAGFLLGKSKVEG